MGMNIPAGQGFLNSSFDCLQQFAEQCVIQQALIGGSSDKPPPIFAGTMTTVL
jgi:hypothetical protein